MTWLNLFRHGESLREVSERVLRPSDPLQFRRQLAMGVFVFENTQSTVKYEVRYSQANSSVVRETLSVVTTESGGELVIRLSHGINIEEIVERGRSFRGQGQLSSEPYAEQIVLKLRKLLEEHLARHRPVSVNA